MLMLARKFANYRLHKAGMPYFHCGPSRQEKNLIKLDQNGEKVNIKK